MFTGIIQQLGTVTAVTTQPNGARLAIATPAAILDAVSIGDSIAVNGCCLTLACRPDQSTADFALGPETMARTAPLTAGDAVHLEPALRAGDPLGGHMVTGHVDGTVKLHTWQPSGASALATFSIPAEIDPRLIVSRGSVAVAGVSLTVVSTAENKFTVQLIPHTLANTLLRPDRALKNAAQCNFEADCLARYALQAVAPVLESQASR